MLLRGVRINKETQYHLNAISSPGRWHPIEHSKRLMAYKLGSIMQSNWRRDNRMVILTRSIKIEMFDSDLFTIS